jgi:hypothetical protein
MLDRGGQLLVASRSTHSFATARTEPLKTALSTSTVQPASRKSRFGLYRRHSAIASLTATSKSPSLLALNGKTKAGIVGKVSLGCDYDIVVHELRQIQRPALARGTSRRLFEAYVA